MVAFGWRIPFLLSIFLVVVGLVVRLRMAETPVFQKAAAEDRVSKTPLLDLRHHWKRVVLGTCAVSITYTLFYLLGTWSLSYGVSTLGFSQPQYLGFELIAVFFFAAFIVVGCLCADRPRPQAGARGRDRGNACVWPGEPAAPRKRHRCGRHGVSLRRLRVHGRGVRPVRVVSARAVPRERALLGRRPFLQTSPRSWAARSPRPSQARSS